MIEWVNKLVNDQEILVLTPSGGWMSRCPKMYTVKGEFWLVSTIWFILLHTNPSDMYDNQN